MSNKKRGTVVSVRLDTDLFVALTRAVKKLRITDRSKLVRSLIQNYVDANKETR